MSLIGRFFKRTLPTKLGRWRTDEPVEIIVRKAELATDDHCGSDLCTKKRIPKNKDKSPKRDESKIIYEIDPLLPYVM